MTVSDYHHRRHHHPHPQPDSSWTLHDYMSLGEVEQGIHTTTNQNRVSEEIQVLPTLLRLLSTMRNLVTLLPILGYTSDEEENESAPKEKENGDNTDPLIRQTVERLEHVAAIHSVAEVVDVVTCYLVPSMTGNLSRVPPLVRGSDGTYDTTALQEVALHPTRSQRGRKRLKREDHGAEAVADADDGDSSDGTAYVSDGEPEEGAASKKRKHNVDRRRTSMESAAEDSQEATVIKTLTELIGLVVASLDPISPQNDKHPYDDNGKDAANNSDEPHPQLEGTGKGRLVLTMDDSILAESGRDGTGGAMEFSDVGSTVAAILHHAPALKSRHVANALCRAFVPQLATLMARVGANSPTSVPSLLVGCIQAHAQAIQEQNTSIANAAKQGVLALAKLSQREMSRVKYKLQSAGIMWDTQLELALQTPLADEAAAARILVEQAQSEGSGGPHRPILSPQQSAGEDSMAGYTKMDDDELSPSRPSEPPLVLLLSKRPVLYNKTLEYFAQRFQAVLETKTLPRGRLMLLLKGYSYLLMIYYPATSSKLDFPRYLFDSMVPALTSLVDRVRDVMVEKTELNENARTSSMDSLMQYLHCAILLSIARILQEGTSQTGTTCPEICLELYLLLETLPGQSKRVRGFRRGIEMAIAGNSPSVLHALVLSTVSPLSMITYPDISLVRKVSGIEDGWKQVCLLLHPSNKVDLPETGDFESLETMLLVLLLVLKQPNSNGIEDSKVAEALKILLTCEQCQVNDALQLGNLASTFVSRATQHLVRADFLMTPLVLSTSLERQSFFLFQPGHRKVSEEARAKFALQVLHAFEYLEAKPRSPFAFDPRAIPLKRVLKFSTGLQASFLGNTNIYSSQTRERATASFFGSLRACVLDVDKDKDAFPIEALFLQAKASFPESDLCCTVCSALLASSHRPKLSITYHFLLRDPLVLLKCPIRIWRTRGLRRIAITVLSSLLESNSILVRKLTPFESSAEEYIASRDLIVLRSLLVCLAGADKGMSPLDCAMTSSLVRSLVAAHQGIAASLIRQGLPERALDWLVEYVPESMRDSQLLLHSLSDRSSLTAAERFGVADAVLRIAIMHGQSNEDESSSMACAALSQLIGSFSLVIGPIDVPVSALIVDDSGLDVTQIARKAAFRILEALMRVRARRDGLRRTCGVALQKLAVLCKNEGVVAGVAGAVAGRRKALLKELYDLVLKASSNMGGVFGIGN